MYTNEIKNGWLDFFYVEPGSAQVYVEQAKALASSFGNYQMRPWFLVGSAPTVNRSLIGSANLKRSFSSANQIPKQVNPSFKKASEANGLLDTIEPRFYAKISETLISDTGFQPFDSFTQVPYFISNFTSDDQFDKIIPENIQQTVKRLAIVDTASIVSNTLGDLERAKTVGQLQDAYQYTPYGGIFFDKIDHQEKRYDYTLQFGSDPRIRYAPGFPTAGLRRLLAQAQLSNAFIRFSNTNLESTVITQGIRAFPVLTDQVPALQFGGIIGRVLYPLGISFLLPIFSLSIVREKENRILAMMRMNGLGDVSGYYISNYIVFYINYAISTFLFAIAGYACNLSFFVKTSWALLFIVLFLWGHIQVGLAFFFGSIFKSSRNTIFTVFLMTICTVIASYIIDQVFSNPNEYPFWIFAWPPFVFYRILAILNKYSNNPALKPYTLGMLVPGDAVFNAIIIMVAEIFLVLIASIYLTQVIPQHYGSSRPWYFPFTWKKEARVNDKRLKDIKYGDDQEKEDNDVKAERLRIETGNYDSNCPLVLKGMRKTFGSNVVVKNATFSVHNGEVFGLLGPNGAGKTSLISMLTGIFTPTSGQAMMGGFDSSLESIQAFQSIGVCPQVIVNF